MKNQNKTKAQLVEELAVLRRSEEKFRSLVETISDWAWEVDKTGAYTYASPKIRDLLGYEPEEVLGRTPFDFMPPADRERILRVFQEAIQLRAPLNFIENTNIHKSGQAVYLETSGVPIVDADGNLLGYRGIDRDITKRKRAEAALAESEKRFSVFMEHLPAGVFIKDQTGRLLFANRYLEDFFGWRECVGKTTDELVPQEVAERMIADDRKVLTEGPMVIQEKITDIHGAERFFDTYKFPIEVEGSPALLAGITVDITERKRAEEALRRSEVEAKRLAAETEALAKIGRIISSTLNIEEVYERFAQELKKLFEFDRLSINIIARRENSIYFPYIWGTGVEARQPGDGIPFIGSLTETLYKTRSSLFIQVENEREIVDRFPTLMPIYRAGLRSALFIPLIVRDEVIGSLCILSEKSNAYMDYDRKLAERVADQIAGAIANAQLFAENKEAQEALRQEEKRYRDLGDLLPQTIFETDEKGNLTFVNRSAFENFGYAPEDFAKGWNLLQMLSPEERERGAELFHKTLSGERVGRGAEVTALRKDQTTFPAIVFSNAIVESGKVIGTRGVVVDITERKRAEEALRKSEEYFRRFTRQSPVSIAIIGDSGEVDFLNERFTATFGYTLEDLPNLGVWWKLAYPDEEYRQEVIATWQEAVKKAGSVPGNIEPHEYRVTCKDGTIRTAEIFGSRIGNKILVHLNDITERKQVEEALQNGEKEARQLAKEVEIVATIGRIISSTLNIEEVYERFAQEVKKLFEFDRLAVNIIADRENLVYLPYVWGMVIEDRQRGNEFPLIGSPTEAVLKTRSSLLIQTEDEKEIVERFPVYLSSYQAGLRSALFIPLIVRDEVIGSFCILAKKSNAYTDYDRKLAESVAHQISGAIANAQLYKKEKQMEKELIQSEERLRLLIELSPLIILMHQDRKFVYLNPAALKAFGASKAKELVGKSIYEVIHPNYWKAVEERISHIEAGEEVPPIEEQFIRLDRKVIDLELNYVQTLDQGGRMILVVGREITGQKKAEKEKAVLQEQLQQATKMEAIGTLAGGIAHDFNNILTAIFGYADLASLNIPEGSKAGHNLQQLIKSAHRAKDLVAQILAFSRQGKLERKPLDIRPIVKEGLKFLRSSLPATIEIRQEIEEEVGAIEADPTQVYQVLMNLCTNAAQAMDDHGGLLEVSLNKVDMDERISNAMMGIEPGPYLRLRVRDSGQGIAPEVLKRIFDPYFTTKGVGKGTGLGLAVVHGIVKSYGGGISVSSEVDKGSTFNIYFPRVDGVNAGSGIDTGELLPLGVRERVLLVDDEQTIVEIGKKILEHLGYEVTTRTSSVEALELFKVAPERFDLVITDMTMPNVTGDKLAQEILKIRPGIPIVLCTGFSESISEERAKALGIQAFVMKPLVMKELANTMRRILDDQKKEKD